MRYESIDTPDDVRDAVIALLSRLDLPFGAFDFTVTPEGEWVFLECDPAGQWLWLQDEVGVEIAAGTPIS